MTCCSLFVAASLFLAHGEPATGAFSPMFVRGQPVWVTRVSRRQLQLRHDGYNKKTAPVETDVATVLL